METYHKIKTVFNRDPETNYKTLIEGQFSKPEFGYLANNEWYWTEKIDGTNIRIQYHAPIPIEDSRLEFKGKTDRADIPPFLLTKLEEIFDSQQEYFDKKFDSDVCLYGEGYGAKIQKGGGNYIPDGVGFILFDIRIGNYWLERNNIEEIGIELGLNIVPIVGRGTLTEAIKMVKEDYHSMVGDRMAEGMVIKPKVELYNRYGERIITKIKHKDFGKQ